MFCFVLSYNGAACRSLATGHLLICFVRLRYIGRQSGRYFQRSSTAHFHGKRDSFLYWLFWDCLTALAEVNSLNLFVIYDMFATTFIKDKSGKDKEIKRRAGSHLYGSLKESIPFIKYLTAFPVVSVSLCLIFVLKWSSLHDTSKCLLCSAPAVLTVVVYYGVAVNACFIFYRILWSCYSHCRSQLFQFLFGSQVVCSSSKYLKSETNNRKDICQKYDFHWQCCKQVRNTLLLIADASMRGLCECLLYKRASSLSVLRLFRRFLAALYWS